MTSKPLYPEGVEVHATALAAEPADRVFETQRRSIDTGRSGRAEGLGISIGSPTSRFVFAAGHGYVPRADLVEFGGVANIALADYTTGVENMFVLAYRENLGTPEAHEDGGSTRNTLSTRSSEIKVMTRAEFAALPASADADLATNLATADVTTDAQDRLLWLASVYGKGFTGPTPNGYVVGDFANGNIVQQAVLTTILTASLPSVPTCTGINLKSIDSTCPVGDGTLTVVVTSASDKRAKWAAPGDTAGALQVIDLTQNIVTLNLPSATSDESLTVEIVPTLLPAVAATYNDTVVVSSFYDDVGPVFSADDELHRSKLGSYIPTAVDPHGSGYPDFAQQVAVIDKTMILGTSRLSTGAEAALARVTTPRSTVGGVDRTLMWAFTGPAYTVRIYQNTGDILEIVANAAWDPSADKWVRDTSGVGTFCAKLCLGGTVGSTGNGVGAYIYASTSPFDDSAWKEYWNSAFFTAAIKNAAIRIGEGLLSGSDKYLPRIITNYPDSTNRTLLLQSGDDSDEAGGNSRVRLYLSAGKFEVSNNAGWDGATWTQDDGGSDSTLFILDSAFPTIKRTAAGAAPWADGAWGSVPVQLVAASGDTTIRGFLSAGDYVEAGVLHPTSATSARFRAGVDTTAVERHLIEIVTDSVTGRVFRKYVAFFAGSPYAHTEYTFNAFWTGTQWNNDSAASGSELWRDGYSNTLQLERDAGAGPWNDTTDPVTPPATNLGGWTRLEYFIGSNGGGLYLPKKNVTQTASTLYADNMPKAFASISLDLDGAISLDNSFGVSGAVILDALNIQVTLALPMAAANYVPHVSLDSAEFDNDAGFSTARPYMIGDVSKFNIQIFTRKNIIANPGAADHGNWRPDNLVHLYVTVHGNHA